MRICTIWLHGGGDFWTSDSFFVHAWLILMSVFLFVPILLWEISLLFRFSPMSGSKALPVLVWISFWNPLLSRLWVRHCGSCGSSLDDLFQISSEDLFHTYIVTYIIR